MTKRTPPTIYTVGHSNQSFDSFARLLELHRIQVVGDVRSYPFSKYCTQFDSDNIRGSLKQGGFSYVYLGSEIGGMPKDPQFYDANGHVVYDRIANTQSFKNGIERLLNGVASYNIALMCGEENPAQCHRRHLIAPALSVHGIRVLHIRGNGSVHTQEDLHNLESVPQNASAVQQLSLF